MNRIIARLKKHASNFEVVGYNHASKGDTIYLIDCTDEKLCEGIENSTLSLPVRKELVEKIKNYFIAQAETDDQFFRDNVEESLVMHIKKPYLPDSIIDNEKFIELSSSTDQKTKEKKFNLQKFYKLSKQEMKAIIPDMGKFFDWMYKDDYIRFLDTYNFCALANKFVPEQDEDNE